MPLMKVMEDRSWAATMRNPARRPGSDAETVDTVSVMWHDAGIRSALLLLGAPFAAPARAVRR